MAIPRMAKVASRRPNPQRRRDEHWLPKQQCGAWPPIPAASGAACATTAHRPARDAPATPAAADLCAIPSIRIFGRPGPAPVFRPAATAAAGVAALRTAADALPASSDPRAAGHVQRTARPADKQHVQPFRQPGAAKPVPGARSAI